MEKRQFTALLLAAIAAAFIGGGTVQLIYLTGVIPVIGRFSEIRAREINLVGQGGEVKVSFYINSGKAPEFVMYDRSGTNRFNFGLAPAGNPGMKFNDSDFNPLITIDTADDKPSITVDDSKGNNVWGVSQPWQPLK